MKQFLIILFVAFLIRVALITSAYHGDLNNNISWGQLVLEHGTENFYEREQWPYSGPNQPPLYILLFGAVAWKEQIIGNGINALNESVSMFPSQLVWFWETHGKTVTLKTVPIIADLGIGFLLFRYFQKRKKVKTGLFVSSLWLLSPISWYNSAIWGQTDPIVNFIGLAAIISLLEKKFVRFASIFTAAFLFKPSLSIFIPVILVIIWKQNYTKETISKGIISALGVVIVSSVLFHPHIDVLVWLFNLYTQRFFPGEIGYLTANAFNLWWIVDPGKTLDSTLYFGISAKIIGYGIAGVLFILVIAKLAKKTTDSKIIFALALSSLITFLFFTRIHERYLFPFFPMATLLLGYSKKVLIPYILLSVVFVINMYHLFWAPSLPSIEQYLLTTNTVQPILSFLNIGCLIALLLYFMYGKMDASRHTSS